MTSTPNDDHEQHESILAGHLARAGLSVPPHLHSGVFAGYLELRAMSALMRSPRDAEAEPAIVFQLEEILRDD
jgi:hypothetical protein